MKYRIPENFSGDNQASQQTQEADGKQIYLEWPWLQGQ